jgi:glycine cleavage system H protein
MVATDRLYSKDHVWVKSLSDTVVVLGISDKFQMLISNPKAITLPKIGTNIAKDNAFGDIEGMKLSVDLIESVCPVCAAGTDHREPLRLRLDDCCPAIQTG